ncbi:DinB family protein [Geminicoccus roseus]|uniref:DinB family protein n=1 Tax=Geminicoccus roseus TaxID=404900 RepID=UPI0038996A45
MDGEQSSAPLRHVLTHAFNHQTHHRGQVHAMFTRLRRSEPVLDYYHTMFSQG